MKTLSVILFFILAVFLFNSCLKDTKLEKYTYYVPVYALKSVVQANIKSGAAQSIASPGKIFVQGAMVYVSEAGKGIHIIDYSQPSSPKNISFIPIPGNLDFAVKGDYLYADEYADLLTIDVANPLQAKLVDVNKNSFYNYYGGADSDHIIASWQRFDTMIKSDLPFAYPPVYYTSIPQMETYSASSAPKANSTGTGGSTSRFTVLNNRLYTVDNSNIHIYNIENGNTPSFVQIMATQQGGIETIYPFGNHLFLGSSNGMQIYDASDADHPVNEGMFGHVRTCDPVIAEANKAYVTLRSGTTCQGFTNELDVLNTSNISNPVLIKSYAFTNPRGLSKEGNTLFVCDGQDGLKILNAADAGNITLEKTVAGFEANDVIVNNGIAIVVASDGLYFIDYKNVYNAHVVAKL